MVETHLAHWLAPILAAIGAAAFICAVFYPLFAQPPLSGRRSAVFEALLKGKSDHFTPATRSARRAQEAALRSVVQQGRGSRASDFETLIAAAGLRMSARRYFGFCILLGALIFGFAKFTGFGTPQAGLAAASAAWFAPRRYLGLRANRRRQAFLRAFAPVVDTIVRGMKSGLSLMDCLAMVANDAAAPVRQEFETIMAQMKAGVPLSAAMEKLAAAMPAPEVRFFTMIMSAQSQTGGNLTEALGNLAGLLRDREKIAAKARIASAEGRMSALIIGALPFAVIGATAAFAPNYIAFLWNDEAGRRIALFCAFWLACGVLVLARMARIEV